MRIPMSAAVLALALPSGARELSEDLAAARELVRQVALTQGGVGGLGEREGGREREPRAV